MTNEEMGRKLDEIHGAISAVQKLQQQAQAWRDKHDTRHEFIEEKLSDHHETLFGNGRDGLQTLLLALTSRCAAVQASKPKPEGPAGEVGKRVIANVLSGVLILAIAWFMFLYRTHVPGLQ